MPPDYTLSRADLTHVQRHTKDVWDDCRGRRILVTGGTGFFGMWLVESFLWCNQQLGLGSELVILTRSAKAAFERHPHLRSHPNLSLIEGDVRTFAPSPEKFDYIIHAGSSSKTRLSAEEAKENYDVVVEGGRHVLDLATRCGPSALLFVSSGAVYGPESAYSQAKTAAEKLCDDYVVTRSVPAKVARCFTFIGPYLPLDGQFAVGEFIHQALKGGPIEVKSDRLVWRSYLYASDLAIFLWTTLFRGESGRPYDIGSSEFVELGDLAAEVSRLSRRKPEVKMLCTHRSGSEPDCYVPKDLRGLSELNLMQRVRREDAILKTLDWYSSLDSDYRG